MNWTCRLLHQAVKQLRLLPQDRRKQTAQAIEEMKRDPTSGDVHRLANAVSMLCSRHSKRDACVALGDGLEVSDGQTKNGRSDARKDTGDGRSHR